MSFPYDSFLKHKYERESLQLTGTGLHYTVQIFSALELQPELDSVRTMLMKLHPLLRQAGIRQEIMTEVFVYAYALDKAILRENFDAVSIFDTHAAYLWGALTMELRWVEMLSTYSEHLLTMLGDNVKQHNFLSVNSLLQCLLTHPRLVEEQKSVVVERHLHLFSSMALLQ